MVRVALDDDGKSLVPTDDEAVRDAIDRAETEAQRAEAEATRRTEAAERALAALRALFAKRDT